MLYIDLLWESNTELWIFLLNKEKIKKIKKIDECSVEKVYDIQECPKKIGGGHLPGLYGYPVFSLPANYFTMEFMSWINTVMLGCQ